MAYFVDIRERILAMEPEALGERSIITGRPEACIEQFRRVAEAGIDEVICYFSFGALSHADTLRQMERFAAEVMPAFEVASPMRTA